MRFICVCAHTFIASLRNESFVAYGHFISSLACAFFICCCITREGKKIQYSQMTNNKHSAYCCWRKGRKSGRKHSYSHVILVFIHFSRHACERFVENVFVFAFNRSFVHSFLLLSIQFDILNVILG